MLHYFSGGKRAALFRELARILRPGGTMVLDTEFAEQHPSLWIVEFFPSMRERFRSVCVDSQTYRRELMEAGFSACTTECIEYLPCEADGILRIGQHKPELYLDDEVRAGMPVFKRLGTQELSCGLDRLHSAIQDGSIAQIVSSYNAKATMPGDVGFIIATR